MQREGEKGGGGGDQEVQDEGFYAAAGSEALNKDEWWKNSG